MRTIRLRANSSRDAAELERRRKSAPIRSATTRIARWRASCIAIRTACCSSWCMSARSIAASASAARWSGRDRSMRSRRSVLEQALDYIRSASRDLGSHPHRRRSAGAVAAPLAIRRQAIGAIEHVKVLRVHTRVPVVDPAAHDARAGSRDQDVRQGGLCGAARQSRARADGGGACGLCAAGRCRHSAAQPVGAAQRASTTTRRRSAI